MLCMYVSLWFTDEQRHTCTQNHRDGHSNKHRKGMTCLHTYININITYIHHLTIRGMRLSNSKALSMFHRSHQVVRVFAIRTASPACPSSSISGLSVWVSGREASSTITMSGSHWCASESGDSSEFFLEETITMNGEVRVIRTHFASPANGSVCMCIGILCIYVCIYVKETDGPQYRYAHSRTIKEAIPARITSTSCHTHGSTDDDDDDLYAQCMYGKY